MNRETLMSLLPNVTQIVVAFVTGLLAALVARRKSASDHSVEQLRQSSSKRQKAVDAAAADITIVDEGLQQTWQALQLLMDEVRYARSATTASSFGTACANIEQAYAKLSSAYKSRAGGAPSEVASRWGDIRSTTKLITQAYRRNRWPGARSRWSARDVDEFERQTKVLLMMQNDVASLRERLLILRVRTYLDLL